MGPSQPLQQRGTTWPLLQRHMCPSGPGDGVGSLATFSGQCARCYRHVSVVDP